MSSDLLNKKYTIINISGKLDKYLGEELIEQMDEIAQLSPVILIDLSSLESIDPDGIGYLQQSGEFVSKKQNRSIIAISSKNDKIREEIESLNLPSQIKVFNDKSVAKEFLEKQYNASIKSEISQETPVPEDDKSTEIIQEVQTQPKKELFYIHCPNCNVKLRAYAEGNHACPKCKTRFFVRADKTVSLYESISLQ